MARLLDDDKFGETLSKLFLVRNQDTGEEVLKTLETTLNAENGGFEWLLWQTGVEVKLSPHQNSLV